VDVRAPHAGVLKAYHASLNDTVAVGAALFTLDTDATAGATAPAAAAPAKAAPPPQQQQQAPAAGAAAAATPASAAQLLPPKQQHARVPSIHFRYGVRPAAAAGGAGSSSAGSAGSHAAGDYAASLAALYPSKPGALPELSRLPSFGRPALSADEEQRIYSGGAYGFVPPPPEKKAAKK
jgi:2-oxoglutarate dehydrogenase E2 component (dihydrolipoamide succinyltransferase)